VKRVIDGVFDLVCVVKLSLDTRLNDRTVGQYSVLQIMHMMFGQMVEVHHCLTPDYF